MSEEHGIYSGVVDIARNGVDEVIRLRALNAELVEALHHISLCSQNSMSSQRQCGDIARAALAKVRANK